MINTHSLEHQLLIAMPNLNGSWFEKTLIYMIEDTAEGSMGLTLTLPHSFDIKQLLTHFDLNPNTNLPYIDDKVLLGGPVKMEHGFILHKYSENNSGEDSEKTTEKLWKKSMVLQDGLAMSVSDDLLKALADGTGPLQFIACLGFSGWEAGQLADEIKNNSWLTIPYNESLVFDTPHDEKWSLALSSLGVSPEFLSMEAGYS